MRLTCSEANLLLDDLCNREDVRNTREARRKIVRAAECQGRLHMVENPTDSDARDTVVVLMIEPPERPIVRVPINRTGAVSLLKLLGDALA